jgi:hypothetical protein
MFKKLFLALVAIIALPFLSRNYRRGFKTGWNAQMEKNVAEGIDLPPFVRPFKNV